VPFETFWRRGIEQNDFRVVLIEIRHAAMLVALPFHHKDPFDRMLAAQALVEAIPIVSCDATLDPYLVRRLW